MARLERILWVFLVGLVTFFGAWRTVGLQPDAALYAGLAAKILRTGEAWRLSGTSGFFPIFFEHPPYFFQWGALVLRGLGESDAAARAVGGLWSALGFFTVIAWTGRRWGAGVALWTAFALATFGHYTKFASTSMLEAPLSTGVALAALSLYEIIWGAGWRYCGFTLVAGLALASAAKGVAGLGAWGGVVLTLMATWLIPVDAGPPYAGPAHSDVGVSPEARRSAIDAASGGRFRGRFGPTLGLLVLAALASAAPLAYWAYRMRELGAGEWIRGYFVHQVARSAVSTRGDASHAGGGHPLFFVKMILLNGWPWWWTVPLTGYWAWRRPVWAAVRNWTVVAGAFFAAYFIPFSLVKFQLAHYIHPTYLVLAPLAGFFLHAVTRGWLSRLAAVPVWPCVRWAGLVIAGVVVVVTNNGPSPVPNRGQKFAGVARRLAPLRADCAVTIDDATFDPYLIEAFALWYWHNRPWRLAPPPMAPDDGPSITWTPASDTLVVDPRCRVPGGSP